jgi:ABC-type sugar transport system ATPase subunit
LFRSHELLVKSKRISAFGLKSARISLDIKEEAIILNEEPYPVTVPKSLNCSENKNAIIGIRPDDIEIEKTSDKEGFTVTHVEALGSETLVFFNVNKAQCSGLIRGFSEIRPNDKVKIKIKKRKVVLFFDPNTSQRII